MCGDEEKGIVCPQSTNIPTVDNTGEECCHEHGMKCILSESAMPLINVQEGDSLDVVVSKLLVKLQEFQNRIIELENP